MFLRASARTAFQDSVDSVDLGETFDVLVKAAFCSEVRERVF